MCTKFNSSPSLIDQLIPLSFHRENEAKHPNGLPNATPHIMTMQFQLLLSVLLALLLCVQLATGATYYFDSEKGIVWVVCLRIRTNYCCACLLRKSWFFCVVFSFCHDALAHDQPHPHIMCHTLMTPNRPRTFPINIPRSCTSHTDCVIMTHCDTYALTHHTPRPYLLFGLL